MSTASTGQEGQPRSRNWLLVILALVVFCCLITMCCAAGWYLYTFGDQLLGLTVRVSGVLV
ncbi:MAG TPA: hypothetical protein VLL77_03300 [Anaerolineales bacterium]|nr:hypothetical protein [Anaerolineales bacterium]